MSETRNQAAGMDPKTCSAYALREWFESQVDPSVPDTIERALDTLRGVLLHPAPSAATPPTPDLAAVREADFAAADSAAKYAVAQNDAPDGDLANLARAYLALRARPLPADVQAAVDALNAKKYPPPLAYDQSIFNGAINEAVDTLLAHLTREAR